MSEILRFRSTWGFPPGENLQNWKAWFPSLKQQGYAGLEINFFTLSDDEMISLRQLADDLGLEIVVQIHTAWPSYQGPRPVGFTADYLLQHYREQLERSKILKPLRVNSHSGSDHWPAEESVEFFRGTISVDAEVGFTGKVSHETHRLRSLFNPYVTANILHQVPELRITADFSHFVVVCERLLDVGEEDKELLSRIIPHVQHIHARMGTTQSSQIPDPTNSAFEKERAFFENIWKQIIENFKATRPTDPISFVPEYGPYPYHPFGSSRDFSEVADSEGVRLQKLFEGFLKATGTLSSN